MAELQILEKVGHGLMGTMREMEIHDFVITEVSRRTTAARSAWELKLKEGKVFTVRLTTDRTQIKITRIK